MRVALVGVGVGAGFGVGVGVEWVGGDGVGGVKWGVANELVDQELVVGDCDYCLRLGSCCSRCSVNYWCKTRRFEEGESMGGMGWRRQRVLV